MGTCVAHGVTPRAYLHLVTKLIVAAWPEAKRRDLLPDRRSITHPELLARERPDAALPAAPGANRLLPA
ncbi:MAG: transposase domain-containing protein [Myxococcales bacterium]|nr:transposase domain-containing protein [Myxococcales bacterium]